MHEWMGMVKKRTFSAKSLDRLFSRPYTVLSLLDLTQPSFSLHPTFFKPPYFLLHSSCFLRLPVRFCQGSPSLPPPFLLVSSYWSLGFYIASLPCCLVLTFLLSYYSLQSSLTYHHFCLTLSPSCLLCLSSALLYLPNALLCLRSALLYLLNALLCLPSALLYLPSALLCLLSALLCQPSPLLRPFTPPSCSPTLPPVLSFPLFLSSPSFANILS